MGIAEWEMKYQIKSVEKYNGTVNCDKNKARKRN